MASLTEHVLLNKWDDDINNAIEEVGGDTSNSSGLPDYAGIIKTQLVSNQAVGEGIYQDFLYVDQDNNTYTEPWDGMPTESTNAIQSKVVAQSIKLLYEQMANTERFQVLLVDEFPKSEVNLSAIYLVRSVCECGDEIGENTYTACYYVKEGKRVRKVEIPEFQVNLGELFYLTRAEYDAGLSDYVKAIEDLLRQKFGKYWDDEGFALDETLDQIVADIEQDLKNRTEKILEDVNARVDEALGRVDNKIQETVDTITGEFNEFRDDIESEMNELTSKVNGLDDNVSSLSSQVHELDSTIKEIDTRVTDNFITLEQTLNTRIDANIESAKDDLVGQFGVLEESLNVKIDEVDNKVTELETVVGNEIDSLNTKFGALQDQLDVKIGEVDNKVTELETVVTGKLSEVDAKLIEVEQTVTNSINDLENQVSNKFDTLETQINDRVSELENDYNSFKQEVGNDIDRLEESMDQYLKRDDVIALADELNELK